MGEMGEMGEIRDRQPATVWGGNMTRQGAYVCTMRIRVISAA